MYLQTGRTWKVARQPSRRSMLAPILKTTWDARQQERRQVTLLKQREQVIKEKTELERQVTSRLQCLPEYPVH